MAESIRAKMSGNTLLSAINENSPNVECAVCLQTCIHPAELPCGHIFCYLCIKGIVNQGRRCAMCRQDIPVDYLNRPRLLKPVDAEISSQGFEDGHLWFYEGHNGWWQYDERTSVELESAYQKGERCCELLIAGFLYIADFDAMLQYRRNDPSRRRRIKRDLATTTKKGVAGLKPTKECNSSSDDTSNGLIQNLPIHTSALPNDFSGVRSLSLANLSLNNSSQHQSESPQNDSELRRRSTSDSSHSAQTSINSQITPQIDDDALYSRNFDLDSIIHDTLDWTIEQIESLNIELLNDYEVLFRDVNNYGQLQGNINRNRPGRRASNYLSQYLNLSSTVDEPVESQPEPTQVSNLASPSGQEENNPTLESSLPSQEINPAESNESESVLPSITPPPRTRGSSRVRSRREPPRRSSSLNCDTLL